MPGEVVKCTATTFCVIVTDAFSGAIIPDATLRLTTAKKMVGSGSRGRVYTENQFFDGKPDGGCLTVERDKYITMVDGTSERFRLNSSVTVRLQHEDHAAAASFLRNVDRCRIRVHGSGGYGHRCAAVLLMRGLRKLGFDKPIDVIHAVDAETVQILGALLPGAALATDQIFASPKYANVRFIPAPVFDGTASDEYVLGIVGASDSAGQVQLADFGADARAFFVLQPYRYPASRGKRFIQRPGEDAPSELILHEDATYDFDVEIPPDIGAFLADQMPNADANRIRGLEALVTAVNVTKSLGCMPIYGLRGSGIPPEANASNMVANILAGLLVYQQNKPQSHPVAAVMLNDHDEVLLNDAGILSITIEELTTDLVAAQKEKKVLYVRCGGVPYGVFNLIHRLATVPSVLEGNNTVNLMTMLNKPFMSAGTGSTSFPRMPWYQEQTARCEELAGTLNAPHQDFLDAIKPLVDLADSIGFLRRVYASMSARRAQFDTILDHALQGTLTYAYVVTFVEQFTLDLDSPGKARFVFPRDGHLTGDDLAERWAEGAERVVGDPLFQLQGESQKGLDAGQLAETLIEQFTYEAEVDMADAELAVVTPTRRWTVTAGGTTYIILREEHETHCYRSVINATTDGQHRLLSLVRFPKRRQNDYHERFVYPGTDSLVRGFLAFFEELHELAGNLDQGQRSGLLAQAKLAALPVMLRAENAVLTAPAVSVDPAVQYHGNFADFIADARNQAVRAICTGLQALGFAGGHPNVGDVDPGAAAAIGQFIVDATAKTDLAAYFRVMSERAHEAEFNQLIQALKSVGENDGIAAGSYVEADGVFSFVFD